MITKKEIETYCEELKQALLATIEIDNQESQIKLLRIKTHARLLKAKEDIRAIKLI